MFHNVRLARGCACPNCDSANTIKETATSGTKVCVARLSESYWNEEYQKILDVSYIFIALAISIYIV